MNDVDAAKARLDEVHARHAEGQIVPVSFAFQRDWPIISAELDRLRKRVVAFEQSAPRLYRCNEENCYLCDADMRHLFPGIDVAALRVSQPEGVASRRPDATASDPEKEGRSDGSE